MRHNSNCSEEENVRRWQRFAQLRGAQPPFGVLPPAVKLAAQCLNGTLVSIEAEVSREIGPTLETLLRRKQDNADPLEDFDVLLTLSYGLRRDDTEWEAEEENLLCVQTLPLYEGEDPRFEDGFGRPVRHCPWADWQGRAPCWTFILLMEYSGIAWNDLPRIASIQRTLIVKTDQAPVLLGSSLVTVPTSKPEST